MRCWLLVVVLVASACQQAPRRHEIAIRNFKFVPDTLRISEGDTVVVRNEDFVPHTATDVGKKWDSGTMGPNASWTGSAFPKGAYAYVCTLHPSMKGYLLVE
jgi:plastocyanin